jgi:uncharacterized linocin/CFP29 family protein
MDLLKRELAPILPPAWSLIDQEAARVLKLNLAARKIVDLRGPHGWHFAAVNLGRLELLSDRDDPDLNMGVRRVQPLMEIRVPIKLSIMELDLVARGAEDPDLTAVVRAAEKVAHAEDDAIFNGLEAGGIRGLLSASPLPPHPLPADLTALPRVVLAARESLRQAGVSGPYALVLGADLYDQVLSTVHDGYPLPKQIDQIIDRPIVRATAIDAGFVLSVRGNDYELWLGQDLSIGYAYHDKHEIELYLTESFTFRVIEPAAAVRLAPMSELG